MKILFCIGEGIGNIAQMVPSFLYLRRKYKGSHIAVVNLFASWPEAGRLFFEDIADEYFSNTDAEFSSFDGMFVPPVLNWCKKPNVKILNRENIDIYKSDKISEVEANFKIIGDDYKDYELCDFGGLFEDEYKCDYSCLCDCIFCHRIFFYNK